MGQGSAATRLLDSSSQPLEGQQPMAASLPVAIASNQSPLQITGARPGNSAFTSVAASASTVTLLASDATRLGAAVYNDSAFRLFLKLGAAASTTSFTIRVDSQGYYEVPFGYTGIVTGVWASAGGNARITEVSA